MPFESNIKYINMVLVINKNDCPFKFNKMVNIGRNLINFQITVKK